MFSFSRCSKCLQLVVDLIEVPRKEVNNLSGTLIEIQVKADARRFIAIVKNSKVFLSIFELDFNMCIQKAKEFFPNIDTNFLTLIDLD